MSLFAADSIDENVHGRVRLTVLIYLSTVAKADFVVVRNAIGITDGTLSKHVKRLVEAGYVRSTKAIVDDKAKTSLSLTEQGVAALAGYLANLKSMMAVVPDPRKQAG